MQKKKLLKFLEQIQTAMFYAALEKKEDLLTKLQVLKQRLLQDILKPNKRDRTNDRTN